jgi:hypothetical protein
VDLTARWRCPGALCRVCNVADRLSTECLIRQSAHVARGNPAVASSAGEFMARKFVFNDVHAAGELLHLASPDVICAGVIVARAISTCIDDGKPHQLSNAHGSSAIFDMVLAQRE